MRSDSRFKTVEEKRNNLIIGLKKMTQSCKRIAKRIAVSNTLDTTLADDAHLVYKVQFVIRLKILSLDVR